MNKEDIFKNFVAKLMERAEQFGGLDYVEGYLLEVLKSLNLHKCDIKFLELQTERLEGYIQEHKDATSNLLDVSK